MLKSIGKIVLLVCVFFGFGVSIMEARAPSFDDNFANFLTDATPDEYGRVETVFSFSDCIDRNQTIMENVRNLFYPSIVLQNPACSLTTGGLLWDVLRVITIALIFVFIVVAGIKFIMNPTAGEENKKGAMSLVYIGYGAFLVFGAIWILGYVLNIEGLKGSTDLVNNIQNNLFLQILSFFKILAFFIAILMMVISGFKMMAAMDKEDKIKEGKTGILNILVALVSIKIIDYVYYIAQAKDFAERAGNLVLDIAKILGWIIGITFVIALFYAGYQMFISGGDEKAMKKTKSILINIVLVSVVLFMFLLLVYQIFNQFVG